MWWWWWRRMRGKRGDDDNVNANKKWQVRGVRTDYDRTERKMKEREERRATDRSGAVSLWQQKQQQHMCDQQQQQMA